MIPFISSAVIGHSKLALLLTAGLTVTPRTFRQLNMIDTYFEMKIQGIVDSDVLCWAGDTAFTLYQPDFHLNSLIRSFKMTLLGSRAVV
jgi:hypothetical protein